MSTNYTAATFYGYSLPRSELTRSKPNPLWGKVKFDPDTGDKVTQSIVEEIELELDTGDCLKHMKSFTRFDSGYEDEDYAVLGVQLAEVELTYGRPEPQGIKLLSDEERAKVWVEVQKLLDKAGITLDSGRMGYWLAGYAG